ncbi:MAG: hypothetical protein U0326_42745 [Polyangiales bacterium]
MRTHALIALSLCAVPSLAGAQSSADLAARQDLVAQADQARSAGDHARALDLAQRAGAIRMTPSLQLMIAQEQRSLGQLVDSYASALACARAAQADASAANRAAIVETCTSVSRALEPQLGRVRLRFASDLPGDARVLVAGVEVAAAAREIPRVVMPGQVTIDASAAGRTPFHRALRVDAGAVTDVTIELPRSLTAQSQTASGGPGAGPWIVAGVGVASLAAAGVMYALAGSARDERDGQCNAQGYCFPIAQNHDARYRDMLTGTNVALIAGGALVAGAALWYAIARMRSTRSEGAPTVAIAPSSGGVMMSGALRF